MSKASRYLSLCQDSLADDGPKNETLAEHREHCEAEPGNCPFEKKMARENEKAEKADADIVSAEPKHQDGMATENETTSGKNNEAAWYGDAVDQFVDLINSDEGAMKLAMRRYLLFSGDRQYSNWRDIENFKIPDKVVEWNKDLLRRGLDVADGFERFQIGNDRAKGFSDWEEDVILHQRSKDILSGKLNNQMSGSKAGLEDSEVRKLAREVLKRCYSSRDTGFRDYAESMSAFYSDDVMREAAERYVRNQDQNGIDKLKRDLSILDQEGQGFLLQPERREEISSLFYETAPILKSKAAAWERNYRDSLESQRERAEIFEGWRENDDDRKRLNAERLKHIAGWIDDAVFRDGSPADPRCYDGKQAGITQEKIDALKKTFENAPYEVVLRVHHSKPMFTMILDNDAYNDDTGQVVIGTGDWTFTPRTVAHECGHNVLQRQGQSSSNEIDAKYQPIVDALHEDYSEYMKFIGEGGHSPTLLCQNIQSEDEFANTRNYVKKTTLLKTLSDIDFDSLGESVATCGADEIGEYAAIADTLCAASNGLMFCGHSTGYYQSGKAKPLHETVANITSSLALGWENFPKLFPKTYAAVKEIVYGMKD